MIQPVLVRGSSRPIVILGDPVAHSLSPVIHNHIFARSGLPFVYVPLPVATADLPLVVSALRATGFAGANVTIPHKRQVMHCCDCVSELSAMCGTVNTLYWKDALLHGTTTDAEGFFAALDAMAVTCRDDHVVILGNGGTARTLAFALASQRPPRSLTLVGRERRRVESLAKTVATTGFAVDATTFDSPDLAPACARCTLLVNCTSVGMHPDTGRSPLPEWFLHSAMAVFDAIYNPVQTLLLQQAGTLGCRVQNGLLMLLHQALASQKFWTGQSVPASLFDLHELQDLVTKG